MREMLLVAVVLGACAVAAWAGSAWQQAEGRAQVAACEARGQPFAMCGLQSLDEDVRASGLSTLSAVLAVCAAGAAGLAAVAPRLQG